MLVAAKDQTNFKNITVLARTMSHMDDFGKQAKEIQLHHDNSDRGMGFTLNCS
jgi:hypothetical protein